MEDGIPVACRSAAGGGGQAVRCAFAVTAAGARPGGAACRVPAGRTRGQPHAQHRGTLLCWPAEVRPPRPVRRAVRPGYRRRQHRARLRYGWGLAGELPQACHDRDRPTADTAPYGRRGGGRAGRGAERPACQAARRPDRGQPRRLLGRDRARPAAPSAAGSRGRPAARPRRSPRARLRDQRVGVQRMGDSLVTTAGAAYDQWVIRFRAALIGALGALVAGIAAIAYLVSFEAISLFAMHSGGIAPKYAWAAPLLVDSFIAVATGADLWFAVGTSQRQGWELAWPKLLLAGAAAVSFILNVAHAKHTWAARGVAALAPAALLLSVELLMLVVRRAATLRALRFAVAQAASGPPSHTAGGGAAAATIDTDSPAAANGNHPAAAVVGSSRRRLSAA